MTYGVIRKPIIGGVTTGHNPAHEAMESRFDDEFVIPRPSTGVVSGKDKNVVLDAIAAAAAEPKGARIRISGGAFDIGDLDISIPKYAGTGKVLQFKGSGFIATTIKRSVDSGPGTWFIKGDSLDTDLYFAIFEDISFAGPGVSGAIGVAPCAMDGVKVGSRMKFNRCHFGLWNRALWLDGNHIEISSSEIHDNYRAIYFGQQYGLSGDVQIYNVAMDGQKRSNFGVANYSIATFHMRSGHLGLCPYNMEFDAGVSGHLSLGGALFDNVSVEQTGNSYFYSSDSSARVSGVTFRRCGNWSRLHASYGLPGVTANPGIKVAEWLGVTFEGGMPTLTTVGVAAGETGALFDVSTYLSMTTDNWKAGSYDGAVAAGRAWFTGAAAPLVELDEGSLLTGFLAKPLAAAAVTAGQVLEFDTFNKVRPWGYYGAVKGELAGVALNSVAAGSAEHVVVIVRGRNVPVLCDGAAASSYHLVASTATAGKATGISYDGTNTSTLGRRIIGPSYGGVAVPTSASTVACQVNIR